MVGRADAGYHRAIATSVPHAPPRELPPWVRLIAIPATIVVFLAGFWASSALISDDFRVSMALNALWVAVCAAGAFVLWRRWPSVGTAAGATLAISVLLVFGYLGLATVNDKTVNEVVAQATPATGNTALATGAFASVAHETSGTASVVELAGGERVLTLTNFETDAGPDLFVYLGTGTEEGDLGDSVNLGGLKGNLGNQQYPIDADVDLDRFTKVVIWCRAFSVNFGEAPLRKS